MAPVAGSMVSKSWEETVEDLSIKRQPLSVRKVRGTWDDQPSTNFLRTLSGTKKAALVPTKPGVLAGPLREGAEGMRAGGAVWFGTGGWFGIYGMFCIAG